MLSLKKPIEIKELKAQKWDFLFINIINWIDTRGVFRVLHEFRNEPMILYSLGGFTDHEGQFGEKGTLISPAAGAGFTSLRFPMEQWGIKFKYLYNAPDTPMDIDGILAFAKASSVMKKLRHARLGTIGYNDMGLYSTGINPTKLRNLIGPEIESMDMLQLQRRMDAIPDTEVAKEMKRITADWEYPLGKPDDSVVGNSVAQLMLKWISDKQVTFIEHYEHHPEWILLGEDGYCPSDFIEGKPQIKNISTVLLGGIAHCSNMNYTEVPVRQVLDHVQSQHFAAVYGIYVNELVDLCKLLDIEVVLDSTI